MCSFVIEVVIIVDYVSAYICICMRLYHIFLVYQFKLYFDMFVKSTQVTHLNTQTNDKRKNAIIWSNRYKMTSDKQNEQKLYVNMFILVRYLFENGKWEYQWRSR